MTLEAGQTTQSLKEEVQAEAGKRRKADLEVTRLQDELKRKSEELEAVKMQHAQTESSLMQIAKDAKFKQLDAEKRLGTLRESLDKMTAAVFGKSVKKL